MPLPMWVIYKSPVDYPGQFVVRRFVLQESGEAVPDAEPLTVVSTLDVARSSIRPSCFNLGRMDGDEPQIAEVWV